MTPLLLDHHIKHLAHLLKHKLESTIPMSLSDAYPKNEGSPSSYAQFISLKQCSKAELTILLLALMPHVKPAFFQQFLTRDNQKLDAFPALGGVKDHTGKYFLPTGETAAFILGDGSVERRFQIQRLLGDEHWFAKERIVHLEKVKRGEPLLSGRLLLAPKYISLFTVGEQAEKGAISGLSSRFITTVLTWEDLVLPSKTLAQLKEIERWEKHQHTLLSDWGMGNRLRAGFMAFFHGAPGTGKMLTATLLGKQAGKQVVRIDLSGIVSKYIGETEKNLSQFFDRAKGNNWILFFDEADAIFGKRTDVAEAHDKYANQEIAYLLQRIETYDGLVIIAANQSAALPEALTRRAQALIHFPMPGPAERKALWRKAFPKNVDTSKVDLDAISEKFEISGANIFNIVQFICLKLIAENQQALNEDLMGVAIRREIMRVEKLR